MSATKAGREGKGQCKTVMRKEGLILQHSIPSLSGKIYYDPGE